MEKIYAYFEIEGEEAILYDSKGTELDRIDLTNLTDSYLVGEGYEVNESFIKE